ncbi:Enterobactin synthetase component F, serine activating enzyme [Cronobacter universalis NCTC 9529]|nr:Enterobactin synthetase component F, serine activating enzyme [Cronobacter universalis NCTC 9529]
MTDITLTPVEHDSVSLPLVAAQPGIWMAEKLSSQTNAWSVAHYVELNGALDTPLTNVTVTLPGAERAALSGAHGAWTDAGAVRRRLCEDAQNAAPPSALRRGAGAARCRQSGAADAALRPGAEPENV